MFLTTKEVLKRYNISALTLYRSRKKGGFPAPVKFGSRINRWYIADLEAFEEQNKERIF